MYGLSAQKRNAKEYGLTVNSLQAQIRVMSEQVCSVVHGELYFVTIIRSYRSLCSWQNKDKMAYQEMLHLSSCMRCLTYNENVHMKVQFFFCTHPLRSCVLYLFATLVLSVHRISRSRLSVILSQIHISMSIWIQMRILFEQSTSRIFHRLIAVWGILLHFSFCNIETHVNWIWIYW